MSTLKRINTLLMALNMPPVSPKALQLDPIMLDREARYRSPTPTHDLLDKIDRQVGILTRFRPCREELTPVGERLRRLERHIQAKEMPPYFYLGAEAERSALVT